MPFDLRENIMSTNLAVSYGNALDNYWFRKRFYEKCRDKFEKWPIDDNAKTLRNAMELYVKAHTEYHALEALMKHHADINQLCEGKTL